MNVNPIDGNTPLAIRLGVAAAALVAAVGVGAWMTSINAAVSALPEILKEVRRIDKEGTVYGNTDAALLRRDFDEMKRNIEAFGSELKSQGVMLREVRDAVRR